MKLDVYLSKLTPEARLKFCAALKNPQDQAYHPMYIYGVSKGHREPGARLVVQIENLTRGLVPGWSLRPDLWPAPARANGKNKTKPKKRTTRATA